MPESSDPDFFDFHIERNMMTLVENQSGYRYLKSDGGVFDQDIELGPAIEDNYFLENDGKISNLKLSKNHIQFIYTKESTKGDIDILDIRGVSLYSKYENTFNGIIIGNKKYSSETLAKFSKQISADYKIQTGKKIKAIRLSSSYTGKEGTYNGVSFASDFSRHSNIRTIGFEGRTLATKPNSLTVRIVEDSRINEQLVSSRRFPMRSVGMYSGLIRRHGDAHWETANKAVLFHPDGSSFALPGINNIAEFL